MYPPLQARSWSVFMGMINKSKMVRGMRRMGSGDWTKVGPWGSGMGKVRQSSFCAGVTRPMGYAGSKGYGEDIQTCPVGGWVVFFLS